VAALLLLVGAAAAQAGDPDTAPPQVELRAAGQEGIVGPRQTTLAFYSTGSAGAGVGYAPESTVTFACTVDARSVPCVGTYDGCCRTAPPKPGTPDRGVTSPANAVVPGPFSGSVAVPMGLSSGPHTVTVTAIDEDGTGQPASVTVAYDRTPPSAPTLTEAPAHATHLHKPLFRYTSTDDIRLIDNKDQPFRSALRRLDPPEVIYRERSGTYIGSWVTHCASLLTCAGRSRASYEGFQRSFGFGVPEWLPPGHYEFTVLALDSVGNKSPRTRYRFRILPGRVRG
jgi:hypothetical protein